MLVLKENLEKRSATIAIVGMGYVGIPLLLRYSKLGYKTIGVDVDDAKVTQLNEGSSPIGHIPSSKIKSVLSKHSFFTSEFNKISDADAIILCVPTPLTKNRSPDMSYISDCMEMLMPHLRKGQVLSLESTTYPGTTEEYCVIPISGIRKYEIGKDFFVVYSPEREDPGNMSYTTSTIPKVVAGHTERCLEIGIALYGNAIEKLVPVSSLRTAEMTKLLENIHRSVNIGLVNEMKIVADKMQIDIYEVIRAAATKPFGFIPYYPGPGLGGHCIPVDPFYLTWKAKEFGLQTKFIEIAGEVNSAMPSWVVGKITGALNSIKKSVNTSRILILGVAYKKNVGDVRESPAIEIINELLELGAHISFCDSNVKNITTDTGQVLSSKALLSEAISSSDLVCIATAHDDVDYQALLNSGVLIVDTRGVYSSNHTNVIKA